jgi:hypothetical protein
VSTPLECSSAIRYHRRSSRFGHASIATTERYTAVDDEIRAAMMAAIRGIATSAVLVFGPRQGAYARKMEPDPKETPDFSAFSKMRRIPLDPESVIGRELHDRFAEFDESFTGHSRIWSVVVKLIGLTAMCSKAVIDLEKQVIELRREVRSRDKE